MKEDSYRPKVHFTCFNLSESKQLTNLQKQQLQKIFSPVCVIHATCFDECFLFHVITGRRYFF